MGSDYRWPLTLPGLLRDHGLVRTGAAAYIPVDGPAGAPEEQLAAWGHRSPDGSPPG